MRRKAQLFALRPDLEIVPLRGNVDTRVRKLDEGNLDAIILAYAGVKRMGLKERVREVLPFDVMIPPCGQGAIGIETRAPGRARPSWCSPSTMTPRNSRSALERSFQAGVGGGCSVPLGINAASRQTA